MRIRVVANASSGYGRGQAIAQEFAIGLAALGHEVTVREIGGTPRHDVGLAQEDLLVLVGGDGTVHHALQAASRAAVAVYQVPTGTENLFARDWGHDAQFKTLARAVGPARGNGSGLRIARMDLGVVHTGAAARQFCLMCGAGPDAAIVGARAARTRAGDGHRAYLGPIFTELMDPHVPRLRIWAEGALVVDGARGQVLVANSRQYALRLDPAASADPTDGLLDCVFLPTESAADIAAWAALCRSRLLNLASGAVCVRVARLRVECLDPAPWQIDGEPFAVNGATTEFAVEVGALRVVDARQNRVRLRESGPV